MLIDKMILTFKFIDQTEVDTSDWKIYRNEEYGFEFKYPTNWLLKEQDDYIVISKTGSLFHEDSYVIIYPNGKSGSGASPYFYEKDTTVLLNEKTDPFTVVRLANGDIQRMYITFSNPPQKNINTQIHTSILVDDAEYKCISDITGKELSEDRCFSGYKEYGIEYGTTRIFGSLREVDKVELYAILKSFVFLRN